MLKKLAIAFAASAFVVTLAGPASACPGMDKKQETADKDAKEKKVAKKKTTTKTTAKKKDKKAVKVVKK
jgi:hypothetical protein